jgi:lysophospholipase L1-like esterase
VVWFPVRFGRALYRVLVALVALLRATRSTRTTELWFGDSHAAYINARYAHAGLSKTPDGQIVWHLGPRLMSSLARNGFPSRVNRGARLLGALNKRGALVPIFIAGEIDVRAHLVQRSKSVDFDLTFVADYVRNARRLADLIGATCVVFVVPVPPSSTWPVFTDFPINGSIDERIAVFRQLRTALAKAVAELEGPPTAVVVDATDLLVDSSGALSGELTDDGCHTNSDGSKFVRDRLEQIDLDTARYDQLQD